MSNDVGLKIRNLRKSKKMTQQDLAEKSQIRRSTISNYEIGERLPNLKNLQKLGKALGVGIEYFNVTAKDEAFDLLSRAKDVFASPDICKEEKEELYQEFMKLYLIMKEGQKQ